MKLNSQPMTINEAFRLYYRPLCLYALHYLGDTEEVEDVVQDCFVDLWVRMKADRTPIENVKSYMYSMVRNRCLDARSPGLLSEICVPLTWRSPLLTKNVRNVRSSRLVCGLPSMPFPPVVAKPSCSANVTD